MKRLLTLVTFLMLGGVTHAAVVSGQGTWETTLLARDLDGNLSTIEAYYDTVQDITWLADANFSFTSGYDADGRMNWADANAWVGSLTLGGYTDWRLADTSQPDANCSHQLSDVGVSYGYNCTGSEMGNLLYSTLGNTAGSLTNTGLFSNIQSNYYWSATEYALYTARAWVFFFNDGTQSTRSKDNHAYIWVVHTGDAGSAVVPVPAAVWLFLSAVGGLLGFQKIKRLGNLASRTC